jgi:large conductance mechanosensitive channel
MAFRQELKEFFGRNNVVGLAIAVVIGAAFGAVVTSFVNDILMQLVAALVGKPNFGALAIVINGTPIRIGSFINAVLMFFIVGLAMFLVVKLVARVQRPRPVLAEKPPETEVDLLRDIRETLRTRAPITT